MLTPEELQVVKDNAKNIRFKIDGKWVAFDDDEDYINACLHHPRIVQAKIRAL